MSRDSRFPLTGLKRALLDREGALRKTLTLAQLRVADENAAAVAITIAQHEIATAETRPTNAEARVYLARALEHIQAADKALRPSKRGDCAALIAKCEQLARDAMEDLRA